MKEQTSILGRVLLLIALFFSAVIFAHPIDDYYESHKNDSGMESKKIPPKLASLFVDEDYPEAIDLLKSMSALKYLNFYGDKKQIENYAKKASSNKGDYKQLLNVVDGSRIVHVFGIEKKGTVRRIIGVVQTNSQFLLIIGKGKITKEQIKGLPALSKEIQ